MIKLNDKFINVINKYVIPSIVLLVIFVAYGMSAVGLINSVDTPQFFTTQALIEHRTIDISFYSSDPHFFVWPDVWNNHGKMFAVRGYLLSMIMIPFHFLSKSIVSLVDLSNFPTEILSDDFAFKLNTTIFIAVFSVAGLAVSWKAITELLKIKKTTIVVQTLISSIVILSFAFGTYIWKYSTYYTRHGVVVLLVSLLSFCMFKYVFSKTNEKKLEWLLYYLLIISFSFGLEIMLFISSIFMFLIMAIHLYYQIKKTNKFVLNKLIFNLSHRKLIISLTIAVFAFNAIFNYHWYESIIFTQSNKVEVLLNQLTTQESRMSYWFSTPLYPTLYYIFWGHTPMPEIIFSNFNKMPQIYSSWQSVDWAKRHIFYGIFFVSPFLLWSLFSPLITKGSERIICLLCLIQFFISILLTTKTLGFWGGNQYDIRYFYPYTLFLALPLAIFLDKLFTAQKLLIKAPIFIMFFVSVCFSLTMGFLGVINMYKPALTGERRIYLDIFQIGDLFTKYSSTEILDAVFLNRANWIISVLIFISFYCFALLLLKVVKIVIYARKTSKHF